MVVLGGGATVIMIMSSGNGLFEGLKDAADCCSLNPKAALAVITEAAGRNERRHMHTIQYLMMSW